MTIVLLKIWFIAWVAWGGSRWVARPTLLSLLSTEQGWVGGQRPATHPEHTDRQTDKQTDVASQPNPLTQRTQGSKYAARHPLALMINILSFDHCRVGKTKMNGDVSISFVR